MHSQSAWSAWSTTLCVDMWLNQPAASPLYFTSFFFPPTPLPLPSPLSFIFSPLSFFTCPSSPDRTLRQVLHTRRRHHLLGYMTPLQVCFKYNVLWYVLLFAVMNVWPPCATVPVPPLFSCSLFTINDYSLCSCIKNTAAQWGKQTNGPPTCTTGQHTTITISTNGPLVEAPVA